MAEEIAATEILGGGEDEFITENVITEETDEITTVQLPVPQDSRPVHVLLLSAAIAKYNIIPTPLVLAHAIRRTKWIIRPDFQSSSEIYRALNDLHTRQRYTGMNLIYLPVSQMVAICGTEPVEVEAKDEEDPVTAELFADRSVKESLLEEDLKDPKDQIKPVAYIIPVNFTSAMLTGTMRVVLEEELEITTKALKNGLGFRTNPLPGWMLAITDCDQVCYYVERMLTLNQLMPQEAKSREDELSTFFGKTKAINIRSLASRKAQKDWKERQEQLMKEHQLKEEKQRKAQQDGKKDDQCEAVGNDDAEDWVDEDWIPDCADEDPGDSFFDIGWDRDELMTITADEVGASRRN